MSKTVTPYGKEGQTKKQEVEQMFDNIAKSYDFLNHFLSLGIDNLWRKKAVKYLAQFKPLMVMDMATGTGDFAVELSQKLNAEKIIGFDLSEEMLAVGRKKSVKKGITNIEYVKGDSENMPYQDNMFDAMTVGFGVRNFENLKKGLSEMLRVLKPGGKLVVLEISQPKLFPVKQIFSLYFKIILPTLGRLFSKDHRAYTYLPESVSVFPEGNDFVNILKEVGYKNPNYKPLTFGICSMYICEK